METLTPESTIEDLDNYVEDCLDQRVGEVFIDYDTIKRIRVIAFLSGRIAEIPPLINNDYFIYRAVRFGVVEKDSGSSSTWRGFEFKTIIL